MSVTAAECYCCFALCVPLPLLDDPEVSLIHHERLLKVANIVSQAIMPYPGVVDIVEAAVIVVRSENASLDTAPQLEIYKHITIAQLGDVLPVTPEGSSGQTQQEPWR